jgi:hypothetical protein
MSVVESEVVVWRSGRSIYYGDGRLHSATSICGYLVILIVNFLSDFTCRPHAAVLVDPYPADLFGPQLQHRSFAAVGDHSGH